MVVLLCIKHDDNTFSSQAIKHPDVSGEQSTRRKQPVNLLVPAEEVLVDGVVLLPVDPALLLSLPPGLPLQPSAPGGPALRPEVPRHH